MNVKPIGDLILLKEHEKKNKTKSGLILTNGTDGDYVRADVIETGDGLFTQTGDRIPMTVKPGDTVMLHKNQAGSNKQVKVEEENYLLVHESELAMIITK